MRDRVLVSIDLEMTSPRPEAQEIIEVAAVKFQNDRIVDSFATLVQPPVPLPLAIQRLTGIQLELSLVPLYEGERLLRAMLDQLAGLGFEPWLFLPGYFERKLARQLQLDGVFMRAGAAATDD